jgi:hypothetical protein
MVYSRNYKVSEEQIASILRTEDSAKPRDQQKQVTKLTVLVIYFYQLLAFLTL